VLAFLAAAWAGLLVILVLAPEIYDNTLRLPPGDHLAIHVAFAGAIGALIVMAAIEVLRRRRWVFWLLALAFLAGALRVPASALQLAGMLPTADPPWYAVLQGVVGVVQLGIGWAMVVAYRRSGVWGPPASGRSG
jgi:hypothetical protein